MKNAMKFVRNEVLLGAVSGAIVSVGALIISHILSNKESKNGVEVMENEDGIEPDDSKYVMGFDASTGEDMSGNPVESEEN